MCLYLVNTLYLRALKIKIIIINNNHNNKKKIKYTGQWYNILSSIYVQISSHLISHLIYPLSATVAGAPQMISQPVSSIFPCSSLPSGTWRTLGLSIPWCCLSTSSSVCLVFFPLSLCLARWFWPDLMNGKHDHTIAVCISLWSSGDLRVVQLPAGPWHRLPCWYDMCSILR